MLMAVLTVSDRCSKGQMTDTAGPAVVHILSRQYPEARVDAAIVPDDEDAIIEKIEQWIKQGAALVLTAGGTGLGPRDRTPEATRRVIDREAPGIAESMRSRGAVKNVFAWLSRGVAGLKGSTLIVNLPGSESGAVDSLKSILLILDHALHIAAGESDHPAPAASLRKPR
jgi:molybdopterin adenylyltransferase